MKTNREKSISHTLYYYDFFYVLVGAAFVRKYDVMGIPLSNLPEPGDDGAPG